MVTRDRIHQFFAALYGDSFLKKRLLLWTFVLLVVPTSLLVALGAPEKQAYIVMGALIFPLHFVFYLRGTPRLLRSAGEERPFSRTASARRVASDPVSGHHQKPGV
jgi:hypothetical protein